MLGEYSAEIVRVVAIVITASMTVDQLAVAQFAPDRHRALTRPGRNPEPSSAGVNEKFTAV
jgi:hypothetical protein